MSLPPVLSVTPAAARAFMREALLLNRHPVTLGAALDHHGCIQIDPINVCRRMDDLILRPRVAGRRRRSKSSRRFSVFGHEGDGE